MKAIIGKLPLVAMLIPCVTLAGIDKVYDPYVEQGETEIELRGIHQFDNIDEHQVKFGVGYGINAVWAVEGYVIADEAPDRDTRIREAELENRFQLTGKGEYWLDLGILTELEKKLDDDLWELKAGPVAQKQFGSWVTTVNLLLEKQFGSDRTDDDVQSIGRAQLKYRLSPALEPGMEYYGDENTSAIGPVLLGKARWGVTPVKWSVGVFAGLNDTTADTSARWELEWEF